MVWMGPGAGVFGVVRLECLLTVAGGGGGGGGAGMRLRGRGSKMELSGAVTTVVTGGWQTQGVGRGGQLFNFGGGVREKGSITKSINQLL